MRVTQTWSAALAFAGVLSLAAVGRAQVTLETPGGVRDSSEVGGTSVRVGRDIDSATVTPDITGAATSSPQIRERLQEDTAERQMLQRNRMEERVVIPRGTVGSYDLSASAAAGGDSWRFKFYNNHWWYWQPNNSWAVYYRNQWIPYSAGSYSQYFPSNRAVRRSAVVGSAVGRSAVGGVSGPTPRYQSAYRAGSAGVGTAPTTSGLRSRPRLAPVPADGYNNYRGTNNPGATPAPNGGAATVGRPSGN